MSRVNTRALVVDVYIRTLGRLTYKLEALTWREAERVCESLRLNPGDCLGRFERFPWEESYFSQYV